jgi:hypothetical protein
MRKLYIILYSLASGSLAVVALVFFLVFFLVKVLWAWTIPDLFPGAVQQGLIAGTISWFTAFKLAIFVAVVAGIGRPESDKNKNKNKNKND